MSTSPQGFGMIPRWLLEDVSVTSNAVRAFGILSGRVREGGIRMRHAELAALLGVSVSTTKRALRELRSHGVLSWSDRDGDLEGVEYVLTVDRRGLGPSVTSDLPPRSNDDTQVTGDLPPSSPVTHLPYRGSLDTPLRGVTRATSTSSDSVEASFEEWYQPFPKKVGKGAAVKAYRAALKKTTAADLLEALLRQREFLLAQHRRGFCPNPATWLNQQRWLDEAAAVEEQPKSPWHKPQTVEPVCPICPEQRLHRHNREGDVILR